VIVLKVVIDFVSSVLLFDASFDSFSVVVGFVGITRRFSQYFRSSIARHLRNWVLFDFKKTI
jgi:phage-related holin